MGIVGIQADTTPGAGAGAVASDGAEAGATVVDEKIGDDAHVAGAAIREARVLVSSNICVRTRQHPRHR